MRPQLLSLLLSICIAIPATNSLTAQTASVDSRLAAQNALFEELYQSDLKNAPERATAFDDLQKLSIRIGEISQLLDDKELRWLELSEMAN